MGRSTLYAAPRIWNSLPRTITDDLNISAPDLKHSSTEGPISNHSVTVIAPVIHPIGRHTARFSFSLLTYLLCETCVSV